MKELVSVLALCYNHERFVKDCLKSIYEQTYENIELIILDNGSKDASVKEIEKVIAQNEGKFRRVELIKNEENAGISKGVNQLLRMAKGEYIKLMSSDDMLDVCAVERLAIFLKNNPQISFVVGNGYYVNEDYVFGAEPKEYDGRPLYQTPPDFSEGYFVKLLVPQYYCAPAI